MLLAVESKSLSPEFPLIVSRVPRASVDARHDLVKTWLRREIGDSASTVEISADSRLQLYSADAMVGKATNQVRWHENGKILIASDADTYDKWSQSIASATRLVRMAALDGSAPADGQPSYAFIMPVLVVSDGTLWVVDYDRTGKRSAPTLVNSAELYVDRSQDLPGRTGKPIRYHLRHLHICTRQGFVNLLDELGASGSRLRDRIFGWAIKAHATK